MSKMDVFEKLKSDFKNIGGTVGNLTSTTFDNLKDKFHIKELGQNDSNKIKSAHYPTINHRRGAKRPYQESEEALKRAEEHIAQMYPGYFDDGFDPVKYELDQLPTETAHDDIDALVEKLTTHVEVVSGRLSGHVVKNHDKLIEGINTVASVEEDLQGAYSEVRSARTILKANADDLQRNMRVAVQTRRKQAYMNMLEICMKLKKANDLQQTLKKAQECGDYGEAMMLCVECFQGVESLKDLTVSQEVRTTVNRLYVETTQKLDNTLQSICGDFEPQGYSKVLEGFMLQGLSGKQMAQKVLTCLKDSIHDNTTKVVRSMLLTKPKLAENLANSGLESSFSEMCRNLPVDLLRPCLYKLFEILFDVLTSYHIMTRWHEYGLQQKQLLRGFSDEQKAEESGPTGDEDPGCDVNTAPTSAADTAGGQESEPSISPEEAGSGSRRTTVDCSKRQEELTQAEVATRSFLSSVHEMLVTSKMEVWEAAAWRIKELLNTIPFKGEDFIQVVDWCQKFLAAGEAFIGRESELRQSVVDMCGKFFEAYHLSNVESLHMCLSTEHWKQIGTNDGRSSTLDTAIRNSPLYVPSFTSEGAVCDVEDWIVRGNPFKREESKKKKSNKQLTSQLLRSRSKGSFGNRSDVDVEEEDSNSESGLESPISTSNHPMLEPSAFEDEGLRRGDSATPPGESSGQVDSIGTVRMVTISSMQILKWIKSYGELVRPLQARSDTIFHGITELFDGYLLTTFMMFSGVSLEDLVWKEDIVTLRLRSTLLRILTSAHSEHKQQVEEIQRTKPAKPLLGDVALSNPFNMHTTSKFMDNLDQPFKSLASKLKDNKLMDALSNQSGTKPLTHQGSGQSDMVPTPSKSSAHETTHPAAAVVASGNLYGLKERVVAVDSLLHIAEEIKSARAALQAALPTRLSRELDNYMSRTVEATQDLRDCIFRGGARLLLTQGMLDPDRGITSQVSSTNYASKEPATSYSPWTESVKKEYATFRDLLNSANLPTDIAAQMWEQGIAAGAECILAGFARVKRCTMEGRGAMSLDLSGIEKSLRTLTPPNVTVNLRTVDQYIKAFYLPWSELSHWSQIHMQEYGKAKVTVLIECIADAFKIKRQQRLELLSQIDAGLAEFT